MLSFRDRILQSKRGLESMSLAREDVVEVCSIGVDLEAVEEPGL